MTHHFLDIRAALLKKGSLPMKHVISHDLDLPTAKRVAERAFAEYQHRYARFDPQFSWATDRKAKVAFQAKGLKLEGAMEVAEREITLDLDIPFLLRPFRGRALEIIDREVQIWLDRAKAGKLD